MCSECDHSVSNSDSDSDEKDVVEDTVMVLCEGCPYSKECDRREAEEPWMLEEQFLLCYKERKHSYINDEEWVLRACAEVGPVTLPETEEVQP